MGKRCVLIRDKHLGASVLNNTKGVVLTRYIKYLFNPVNFAC